MNRSATIYAAMTWLPLASRTVNPARLDLDRCVTGGIIGVTQNPVGPPFRLGRHEWPPAGIGEPVVDSYVDPEFGGCCHVSE